MNGLTPSRRLLPGFHLTLGLTLTYLTLLVLIPLSAMLLKTLSMDWGAFVNVIFSKRVMASFQLSLTTALLAALVNTVFGGIVAWVLIRYSFPAKRLVDGLVDLPFALPTAVAGISLTAIFSSNGWIGQYLERFAIKVAFTPIGITVALIFIGLPFVVRTVQPVLEEWETEAEEAAASLGASRLQIFRRIILPHLLPSLLTGFSLSFARGLGEYGSVVFISGNLPFKTEIVPLLIITRLEQYDYEGATAIGTVMLLLSFSMLLVFNLLQWWDKRH
ncbi:sulfate ABC transporter permease subunit CysT [Deltaproteobacteria bacterium TL4]